MLLTLRLLHCLPLAMLLLACSSAQATEQTPRLLTYEILRQEAHDPALFTQGLLLQNDWLVETSGGYGRSLIRRYHSETSKVTHQTPLPQNVFAEGVAQVDDQLFLLTWREGICYVLKADTFEVTQHYEYTGEGWGLTYDGRLLIMSDGSSRLTWRRPSDFSPVREVTVTGGGRTWHKLNELEYARGLVWANVWQDDVILAIDPRTGQVRGILDLSALVAQNSQRPNHSVLNGIAYDKSLSAFWITGKLWPRRYLLKVNWPEEALTGNPQE